MKRLSLLALIGAVLFSCQPQEKTKDKNQSEEAQPESATILVTEANFPTAYSNMRMGMIAEKAGGVNQFMVMPTPPSDPAGQPVVRMNRDTYYSSAVVDMKGDVAISIPETDRYVSIQIVDENHETQPMIYGSGRHEVSAKTDHAFVIVRALEDSARMNIQVEATSNDPFEMKEWDMESFKKLEEAGNLEFSQGYDQAAAFGNTESGQTEHMNFVGAAGGWGGAMVVDNIYHTSDYMDVEGCYTMTFPNPMNEYFWSATVYDGNGYLFNDIGNISSEMNPEQNEDGTYTIRFGCDGQPNNIPIREGNTTGKFNVLMRHYGPSDMVRNNEEGYDATKAIVKIE